MTTVPEATETIIRRSRYLMEALSKDIINSSSLARYIKPELETMLGKNISDASILMAIKRLSRDFKPKYASENLFKTPLSFVIHSNLFLATMSGNPTQLDSEHGFILTTTGLEETTIVASNKLRKSLIQKNEKIKIIKQIPNLAAITIELPTKSIENPSKYYFFLKSLAWEGINIVEIFSTAHELTLVVYESDLKNSLGIIQSLFNDLAQEVS